jgi:uncharacterized membrane protein YhiD involved in acid resistance
LALGIAAKLLGLLALWVLKWVEDKLRRERSSRFVIEVDASGSAETEIRRQLRNSDLLIWQSECVADGVTGRRRLIFRVHEIRRRADTTTPAVIGELVREPDVVRIEWRGGS